MIEAKLDPFPVERVISLSMTQIRGFGHADL